MPKLDGFKVLKNLKESNSLPFTVVLTASSDNYTINKCLNLNVKGFYSKDISKEDLHSIITNYHKNKLCFSKNIIQQLNTTNKKLLTNQEVKILQMLCKKMGQSEIAKYLNVSPLTVKTHFQNIRKKTKTASSAGLIIYAIQNGLFNPFESK